VILPHKDPKERQKYMEAYRAKPKNQEKAKKASHDWYYSHHEYAKKRQKSINAKVTKQERKKHYRNTTDKLRIEVFSHYAKGKISCNECHESNLKFLAIDHIPGRKSYGMIDRDGDALWRKLRQNNYPSGYQVLCHNCNSIKYRKSMTLSNNPEAIRSRKNRLNLKKEIFSYYSPKKIECSCCGFSEIMGLTIDHINPRKSHGHTQELTGKILYYWLKKNGFPPGYQILCFNCNHAKTNKNICPHQK